MKKVAKTKTNARYKEIIYLYIFKNLTTYIIYSIIYFGSCA